MKYKKITITAENNAEDIISSILFDMDITEIEIKNSKDEAEKAAYDDFPELAPDIVSDGMSRLSFYVDETEDTDLIISNIKEETEGYEGIIDVSKVEITQNVVDDADWKDNWKKYFHSFEVGDIFICPSWEEVPDEWEGNTIVRIDPGMSFGTGAHESTRLIIKQMKKYITADSKVLDMGCGSGILSIVAGKIGSKDITGVDIDPDCLISTEENLEKNDIPGDTYKLYSGDITVDEELTKKVGSGYDVVLCNILADIIVGMLPKISAAVKKGGILITSGIINFKEEMIKEALIKEGFEIKDVLYDGEWVSITGVRS
ncbi:MAG: 50S ribosomal protein L11 methyltransferase [Lachnospiraceae bacterium]|nr:50S ribosomal protein L11 methyltransferase [Lachnospiraceae bacterium]